MNSTIYLAPYDPAWPSLFTRLAKQVHEAIDDASLLLEHVGSTSVPGLSTKRELAARTCQYIQNYADAQAKVVQEILARARRSQV